MVNENFDKFQRVEQKHQGVYIGSGKNKKPGKNDEDFNNQSNTDKSPGAGGRQL